MDLVDYGQEAFEKVKEQFREFAMRLEVPDLSFIPVSALIGDNVVDKSDNMPWYEGPSLLHHLETVHTASDRNMVDVRFPVQYVIRPMSDEHHDYRGYAGTVSGGVMKPGDDVVVLPSGFESTIKSIDTLEGPVDEAFAPMAVTVRLNDEIDISRGDMICRPNNQPIVTQDVDAMVAWMDETSSLSPRKKYSIKHSTRAARIMVKDINYRLDINTLHRDEEATELALNEIGRISFRSTMPLFIDEYRRNRETGSFVLIDESTNATVAAGMILGETAS